MQLYLTSACCSPVQLDSQLSRLAQRERYARFRGTLTNDSRPAVFGARWKYAFACVLSDLNSQRRWHSWAAVREQCRRRREYLPLWQRVLSGEAPAPKLSARLVELENELQLSDILFFRMLAQEGCSPRSNVTNGDHASATRPQLTRSTSDGQLASPSSPMASFKGPHLSHASSAMDVEGMGRITENSHRCEPVQPPSPSTSHTTSPSALRLWLRNGPYMLGSTPQSNSTEDANEHGADVGPEYSPLHVSCSHDEQLISWMHDTGVLADESDDAGRKAPVQWRLSFTVDSMRLRLLCHDDVLRSGQKNNGLHALVVEGGALQVNDQSDLDGSTCTQLSVSSFSCSAQPASTLSSGWQPTYPLVDARAVTAPGLPALSATSKSWPATVGSWLTGSPCLSAGSEAGSQLDVIVQPLSINVHLPTAACMIRLIDECNAASLSRCGPILPAPMPNHSATFTLRASTIAVSNDKLGVLELEIGDVELSSRSPAPDEPWDSLDTCIQSPIQEPEESTQTTRVELVIRASTLRLKTLAAASILVAPFSTRVVLHRTERTGTTLKENVDMHISDLKASCAFEEVVAACEIVSPLLARPRAGSPASASQKPPAVCGETTSNFVVQRLCSLHCDRIRFQATCSPIEAIIEASGVLLVVSTCCDGNDLLQTTEARLAVNSLNADITIPKDREVSLQACLLGLECSHSHHDSRTQSNACVTSVQMSMGLASCDSEVLKLQLPAVGQTEALSASLSSDVGLDDMAISLPPLYVAISNVALCLSYIHTLSTSCATASGTISAVQSNHPHLFEVHEADQGFAARKASAIRCDLCSLEICLHRLHAPDVASDASTFVLQSCRAWVAALRDRSGGLQIESQIEELCVRIQASSDSLSCTLLHPMQLMAASSWHSPDISPKPNTGTDLVSLHIGQSTVELSTIQRQQLAGLLREINEATSALAVSSDPPCSSTPCASSAAVDVRIHAPCFVFDLEDALVTVADLSVRLREVKDRLSVVVTFDSIACDLTPQRAPSRVSLFYLGRDVDAATPALHSHKSARFDVAMQSDGMLIEVACAQMHARLCPMELDELMPLLICMRDIMSCWEMPEASDLPFAVEARIGNLTLTIANGVADDAVTLRVSTALTVGASMAGGINAPASQRLHATFNNLCADFTLPAGPRVLLLTRCSGVSRIQCCVRRVRAVFQTSDVHIQASYEQMVALLGLLDAIIVWSERLPFTTAANDALPVPAAMITECASRDNDNFSETSEYFDAREYLEEGSPLELHHAERPHHLECAAQLGLFIITLLDDRVAATPILQLWLETTECSVRQRPHGNRVISSCLQIALHHHVRQHWEPVLAPCSFNIGWDVGTRSFEMSSSGPVEFDVSTRLVGSLVRLQQRMSSAAGSDALTQAPFVLRNETGTPMAVWVNDSSLVHTDGALIEVEPGGHAFLAESPSQLAQSGRKVRVVFKGFQQFDIRPAVPPYVRRCRLWPAPDGSTGPTIINVLLESREESGAELCTFHSRFVLMNECIVRGCPCCLFVCHFC